MYFKIKKDLLLNQLQILNKAISSTCPIPILNGFKFIVQEDKITLISSDGYEFSIKSTIYSSNEVIIKKTGEIVIDSKYLLDIIRKLEDDMIEFELIDTLYLKISGFKTEYKLSCFDALEYPNISFEINSDPIQLDFGKLNYLIKNTEFACDSNNVKPVLNGINMKLNNKILTTKGTNSYRISTNFIEVENSEDFNITIPAKKLVDILKDYDDINNFDLFILKNRIIIKIGEILYSLQIYDDEYPEIRVKNIDEHSYKTKVILNSRELKNVLSKLSFIKGDGKSIITLYIESNQITFKTNDSIINATDFIEVISKDGEDLEISFEAKYISDALKVISGSEVNLFFFGINQPLLILDPLNKGTNQIIASHRTH